MDEFDNTNTSNEASEQMNETENNGYTVTPDGGFYTRQRDEIIQDDVFSDNTSYNNKAEPVGEPDSEEPPLASPQQDGGFNGYFTEPQKKPKVKKEKSAFKRVVLAAVVIILSTAIGAATTVAMFNSEASKVKNDNSGGTKTENLISINVDEQASSVVEAVAEKVTPSVVGIRTTTSVLSFFGGSSESTGEGSGVVYTSDGYIITNYHVIGDAVSGRNGKIEVFVDSINSEPYTATVVGYNISADLAVIKISAKGLSPIEFSDSEKLKVGQYVVTVGNPGGLEFMDSVTYGVISGLNRVVSSNSNIALIQTDAAINPGNSGGALVNVNGQLVGINSSKIVSEQFEAMGFAIPSNTVKEITDNIISKENSPEPYLGISISEKYTATVLKYYGFPSGAVVLSVADGSPADNAGISRGDIITEFNGTEITEYTVLEKLISKCAPGDSVKLKVYRSGRTYSVTLTVGSNNQVG